MRFLIAGASGFLGQAWARFLTEHGHEVVRLVRRPASAPDESTWDPSRGSLDQSVVDSADVVANLAGSSLVHVPWTKRYGELFTRSRVDTTRTLAEAVARSPRRPVFLAQTGTSSYGDRGAEVITEKTPTDAPGFMAEVTRMWEAAAEPAWDAGARVVVMRTGAVLDRRGGALKSMLIPFRLGLGGPVGDGSAYIPTISMQDWVGAATYLALNDLSGVFNVTGPDTATNLELTEALAEQLHRPTLLRAPAWALRLVLGPPGGVLTESARVEPERLLDEGYAFAHDHITTRVAAALS